MPGRTSDQRWVIERAYRAGLTQVKIAASVGKSPDDLEGAERAVPSGPDRHERGPRVGGGAGVRVNYSATCAHREATRKACRPKPRRLDHAPLREKVWELLRAEWSPEQIAAMLPVLFPHDPRMRVSHETIYQSLFVQTKGELKRELTAHLRTQRQRRKPQTGGRQTRARSGSPTTSGSRHGRPRPRTGRCLGTGKATCSWAAPARARSSPWSNARPVRAPRPAPGHHRAELARRSLTEMIATLPLELRKSITWDRGSEMAQHARFSVETGIPIYFCDPQSPWQRGTNENTNGLLRQYWPKGADLRHLTRPSATTSPWSSTPDPARPSTGRLPVRPSTRGSVPQRVCFYRVPEPDLWRPKSGLGYARSPGSALSTTWCCSPATRRPGRRRSAPARRRRPAPACSRDRG